MSTLSQIEKRHGRDRWKDIMFIGVAVLFTALSIGAVTSKAIGKHHDSWRLTVVEQPQLLEQQATGI